MAQAADAPAVASGQGREGLGYWALVWGQFRKNRLAFAALIVIVLMFLLAAWAPLLANGKPLRWTENGQVSYPLLQWLVAPSEGLSVDYLFNYFFFLSLAGPLLGVPVWFWLRRRELQPRVFRRRFGLALGLATLLAATPFLDPGLQQRGTTSAERRATPGLKEVRSLRVFRRFELDRRDYGRDALKLDAARGDGAGFPPVAQDPITQSREITHPPGAYVRTVLGVWREMTPEVLLDPNIGNIQNVCFVATIEKLDGARVFLEGHAGRVVCATPQVLEIGVGRPGRAHGAALPGTPLWLAGALRHVVDETGAEIKARGPGGLEQKVVELALAEVHPLPPPTRFHHWLGTDDQGRDALARVLHGARISISVGLIAVAIATLMGVVIGGLAGYYRGWVDIAVSRLIELVICFPAFFLVITIIAMLESRSIVHVMLVMGLTGWTGVARLVRGEFLKLGEQDFVHAARALGCAGRRIMFRHILPNAMGPVLVAAAFGVAGAVLTESGLAYLGFGAPPPTPTWGEMISQGKAHIFEGAWWLLYFPGFLIFLTVTVYNLAGDGLRDAMDPRLRK